MKSPSISLQHTQSAVVQAKQIGKLVTVIRSPGPAPGLPLLLLLAGVQEAGGGAGGEGEEVPRHGPRSIEIRRSEWPGSAGLEVASF